MITTARQLKDLIRNMSKKKSADAQILMRNYMMERFLERISLSDYKNQFILKGGMLVAAMVTSNVPIIFLTASDEETSIIMGLDIGGDDYITKPFKLGVLISRINALLRRVNSFQSIDTELQSNGIKVLLLQGQVFKNGALLDLTAAEYKLLCLFMRNPNMVLTKAQILDKLWDCDGNYIDSSTLTVYMRRLRMKIEDNPSEPKMLLTVRGMGYKWNVIG